ncbi:hypothetical protein Tsubulata_035812 [Turnera subulata]|uniref:Uncharacterized protein n=1 Tax=Turnera subulata TaxID=218843 RepID=A0A9Q0JQW6_9ROSI|nr:hypothetical protein Tsubulata_035812 [Turnera subulata]
MDELQTEIFIGEIKLTAVSNGIYKYCTKQDDVLSEKERIILDNLHFGHERKLKKVFANSLAACQQHFKDILSEKQDILRRVKLVLEDLIPVVHGLPDDEQFSNVFSSYMQLQDIEDLYILPKEDTKNVADQSGQEMEVQYSNQPVMTRKNKMDWYMPNLKTYLPAYTMLQQEAIRKNVTYLQEGSQDIYRLIMEKLKSKPKGFESLKQHLGMATTKDYINPTVVSYDSGLISVVAAKLGSPAELVSGFFENGLLSKLEVDARTHKEVSLLPRCIQQSVAAYVTEVFRFKRILPLKIFLRCYSTGPDWENDGVSYFPSYHLIVMDYTEELYSAPFLSIKRDWHEALMEEKEVQKRKALSMKHMVETLRYFFCGNPHPKKVYAITPRILILGKHIYGNRHKGYQALQGQLLKRLGEWCNGEFEASAFCKGHYCSLMQGRSHKCVICNSPQPNNNMSEDYAFHEEAAQNLKRRR